VHIPALFGTWMSQVQSIFEIKPGSVGFDKDGVDFDYRVLNATATDVSVIRNESAKGIQYQVSFVGQFNNPILASLQPHAVAVSFWTYYEGVPIAQISTVPDQLLELKPGRNSIKIEIKTRPEYTAELMLMIGKISDGIVIPITIKDFQFSGRECPTWLVDLMRGKSFDISIPSLADSIGQ
jgi:hypothetical protein